MRCSLGSVTVSESISPGRIGRSPERRQPGTREIPYSALALEWSNVVGDGALHGETLEGTNREMH